VVGRVVRRFRRPDSRLLPEILLPPEIRGNPMQTLRARHETDGLVLHARTALPSWLGARLDVGYAIDVLHPRTGYSSGDSTPRDAVTRTAELIEGASGNRRDQADSMVTEVHDTGPRVAFHPQRPSG
jgi:hypothetical protein